MKLYIYIRVKFTKSKKTVLQQQTKMNTEKLKKSNINLNF